MSDQFVGELKVPKTPLELLRADAFKSQGVITDLDEQIEALTKKRTVEKGKLRSITSKIVTIQLNGGAE